MVALNSHHNHEEGERHGCSMSMLRRRKGRSQSPRGGREPARKGRRLAREKATPFLCPLDAGAVLARSIAQQRAGRSAARKLARSLVLFQMRNNCISGTFAVLLGATDGAPKRSLGRASPANQRTPCTGAANTLRASGRLPTLADLSETM